jgi:quaternary ammonium compound-resistance protein SugE
MRPRPHFPNNVRDGPAPQKEPVVAWIYLFIAAGFEIVWVVAMKYSLGFTRLMPSVVTIVAMVASIGLLSLSMRTLPLSIAYVVWTGIGSVGAFLIGTLILGEAANAARFLAAALIVTGIVLMKASASP